MQRRVVHMTDNEIELQGIFSAFALFFHWSKKVRQPLPDGWSFIDSVTNCVGFEVQLAATARAASRD